MKEKSSGVSFLCYFLRKNILPVGQRCAHLLCIGNYVLCALSRGNRVLLFWRLDDDACFHFGIFTGFFRFLSLSFSFSLSNHLRGGDYLIAFLGCFLFLLDSLSWYRWRRVGQLSSFQICA